MISKTIMRHRFSYSVIRSFRNHQIQHIPSQIPSAAAFKIQFLTKLQSRSFQTNKATYNLQNLSKPMSYFVIGVSGVTCGGKTTLTKLLQRSFPWCRIIHQDYYFYDDDYAQHLRVPEIQNHVNYEIMRSMNMDQMHKDIQAVLDGPGEFFDGRPGGIKMQNDLIAPNSQPEDAPNFDSGMELLKSIGNIDFDTSKYNNVPILIIEGFIIYESQFIFDKCNVRLFSTLDQQTCRLRRMERHYNPPDCPGYFDKIAWPEYVKHFDQFVNNRTGIKVFDAAMPIETIWRDSVEIVKCRLKEKYFSTDEDNSDVQSVKGSKSTKSNI